MSIAELRKDLEELMEVKQSMGWDDDDARFVFEKDQLYYGCLSAAEHCVTDNPLCLTDKN